MVDIASINNALDLDDIAGIADVNGGSPGLAIALHQRFGCKISLICLDRNGKFTSSAEDMAERYLANLRSAGVEEADIEVVTSRNQSGIYDVVISMNCFGTRFGIAPFKKFLDISLHDQSRIIIDFIKGSGAYPFLNQYGGCNTLTVPTKTTPGLVVMSVEPQSGPAGDWSAIATDLAGKDGFFTDCGEHSFLYVPRGDTLVVTFDNLDIAMTKREERRPWGFSFIESRNWSMLGVMANGWTWFRDQAVTDEFDRLRDTGFFNKFRRVVFYGASMGGYAAAAYSAAAPGSTVFVISPQSTLDKNIVPWEMRYKKAWDRDFSNHYGDASVTSQNAEHVHLMYDPYVAPDTAHAARFTGKNVTHWRCPMLGHRLGSSLSQMGILQEIAGKSISGELDKFTFHRLLRKRHEFPRFQRELANMALEKGHDKLALQVCNFALRQQDTPFFRNMARRISKTLS